MSYQLATTSVQKESNRGDEYGNDKIFYETELPLPFLEFSQLPLVCGWGKLTSTAGNVMTLSTTVPARHQADVSNRSHRGPEGCHHPQISSSRATTQGYTTAGRSYRSNRLSSRPQLNRSRYVIIDNIGDQWSDILESPEGCRNFKYPTLCTKSPSLAAGPVAS